MKTLETLLTALNETKKERDELKLWLEQKEIVEYYEWKEENPKDRTAMDKVIAVLKEGEEPIVRSATAIHILDEISNDPNMPLHTRTQIWSIVSELERVK
jgi:hypothetical protein